MTHRVSRIRPFVLGDVPRVAELHESILGGSRRLSMENRRRYLGKVFLENPWYDDTLPSLVAEEGHGRIVGFLGVLPRRMSWNGRSIKVAIGSQYMVEPHYRGLTGLLLQKAFLSGPQDLSMTDGASHESVKLWKAVGGTDSPLHSIHWTRPLRPLRDGLALLPGSFCPHYDGERDRRAAYRRLVGGGELPAGWAAEDGVAALFDGARFAEAVASRPGRRAYRVTAAGEQLLDVHSL